jgi:hypothetical protein
MFSLNQIVRGKFAGVFVIMGFTQIGGEQAAYLKELNEKTGKLMPGGLALPLDAIKLYN